MVGQYGLLTMGVTYLVAIVLPVVATFFFRVFSMLEDSGYLPRLAVMANRQLQTIGLNGKAVLPMVLGLGCDTMATLTARIMETKKERVLVTLLLALGIPCSSQLSVIFAMMQRTLEVGDDRVGRGCCCSRSASSVGSPRKWSPVTARATSSSRCLRYAGHVSGEPRLEDDGPDRVVLKEAVPLFLVGTALLFFLDFFKLLGAGSIERASPSSTTCSASGARTA